MILLLKHRKPSGVSTSKIVVIIIAVLLLGFLIGRSIWLRNSAVNSTNSALQNGNSFYSFLSILPNLFSSKSTLIREIETLKGENESLQLSVVELGALTYENQRLREEIHMKPEGPFVHASVMARPPQIAFDTLLINRGEQDGVEVGDRVLVSERIIAGLVVETRPQNSIVALNSDSGNSFTAFVARTGEAIEIKGVGAGNFSAKTVSDFDIKEGDSIVASGDANYVMAVVGRIELDSSGGTKNVLMSLPFNVSTVQSAFILK